MKVLFIANAIVGDSPGVTGGELRFIEIAKNWAKEGHEIHVLTSLGGKKLCEKFGLKAKFHIISTSKSTSRPVFIFRTFKSFFVLPKSLKEFDKGVACSTSEQIYDVLPVLALKRRDRGKFKWVTVVHWLPPFPPWRRKESKLVNSCLFFLSERSGVYLAKKFADLLLPVSPSTSQQLEDINVSRSKVFVVECGVNFDEIRAITTGVKEKRYDAVYMKRLQAVKGVFDIIDVWEEVVKHKKDAKLAIIGSGIDERRAKKVVQEKGLQKNITFLGVIYDVEEKFKELARGRLFVLTSYEENWAIAIGEAMATGLPVICYDLKELREVWDGSYIGIPVGNKAEFVKGVLELLDDQELCDKVSRKAQEFVWNYDWGKIAKRELRVVEGLSEAFRGSLGEKR